MVRNLFFITAIASIIATLFLSMLLPPVIYLFFLIIPYIALGLYDMGSTHNVLRNYPVLGHLRYFFEFVRPEIQQYFVQTDQSGRPFSREQRSVVYQRAKKINDTLPFG